MSDAAAGERFECVGGGPCDGLRRDCYGRAAFYVRMRSGDVHHYALLGQPTVWDYQGRLPETQAAALDPNRVIPVSALG